MLPNVKTMKKHVSVFSIVLIIAIVSIGKAVAALDAEDASIKHDKGNQLFDGGYGTQLQNDPMAELGLKGKVIDPDEIQGILREKGYECEVKVKMLDVDSMAEIEAYIEAIRNR